MSTETKLARELSFSDLIAKAGGTVHSDQAVIFEGQQYNGTKEWVENPIGSIDAYKDAVMAEQELVVTDAAFDCAINDLLVCSFRVARSLNAGFARTVKQYRGHVPSEKRIEVGYDSNGHMQYESVGSDWVSLPGIPNAQFKVENHYGSPTLYVQHPRLHVVRRAVDGFIDFVRTEIKERSIYRHKVITPSYNHVWVTPVKAEDVIYNDDIQAVLGPVGLGPIMYPDARDKLGVSKKVGMCLAGEAGTGKSMFTGLITTVAQEFKCTVVKCEAGGDLQQIGRAFKVAKQYQSLDSDRPVVIIVEDIEKVGNDPDARAQLLDMFDGMDAKGLRLVVIATTNFPEQLDPALLRPGRLDQLVVMKLPDLKSFRKLIEMKLGDLLTDDIDWAKAFPFYAGYTQSWIVGSTESVLSAAVWRAKGQVGADFKITTDDLIGSALAYRDQYDMQQAAKARPDDIPSLDKAFRHLVGEVQPEVELDLDGVRDMADEVMERRMDGASVTLETESGKVIEGHVSTDS